MALWGRERSTPIDGEIVQENRSPVYSEPCLKMGKSDRTVNGSRTLIPGLSGGVWGAGHTGSLAGITGAEGVGTSAIIGGVSTGTITQRTNNVLLTQIPSAERAQGR